MSRLLALFFVVLAAVAPGVASAQQADRPLARAMDEMRSGNWAAAQITARGDGQAALDVILWHYLRAGQGDARQVQAFVARNPDWPGMDYLREKSEGAMVEAPHVDVRAFYDGALPQTGAGALSLARAYRADGQGGLADAELVLAWRTLALSSEERAAFLSEHGTLLKPHHAARLDMALWKGWESNARAVLGLVDDGQRALAEARLALQNEAAGVDTLIARVPEALQNDPGLAHDRFEWRMRKGRDIDAVALLLERSENPKLLGEPWAWAGRRRTLARDRMREGNTQEAYRIASTHFLSEGSDYADLEWLSGYLALRFLKKPQLALEHFQHLRAGVDSPISLGRAGYWIGRAYEALGNDSAAKEAYGFGAQYQTSFYGLLAADRGGVPVSSTLSGREDFPPWQEAAFTASSVFKAGVLLLASGEMTLATRFFTHLAESLDRQQIGQMGDMLAQMGQPHIQVMLGKRAAQAGIEVPGPYYALHPLINVNHPVPTELVLAIARRESEFSPRVVSGVGARGLMQVMPRTAEEVSGWIDEPFSLSGLLDDPAYNARLGAAYLASLARQFDGNVVMIAAGYNAGPSRPVSWMERFGDPRKGEVDVVDFIEFIPFRETQNYVMRVAESLPVYRARLGLDPLPVPFLQELTGSTLMAQAGD
ncbi:lytic transglycosylase domain-containing protein [Puniceibacterium sp. IMCC21224]|uniref:lytic transglycosylase domain-containing protein n=1 Tax=Puniceibacterium sp. IMCC21224 TaxID=1618204 RepID=UPI00064DFF82|nr:lytic transglycosylase domain-containing protein [Puniceibacterium sp. IMCC21224]KMK68784.1 soluble lytic murein transglycosylase-like protein [Puniceibacterium sp. IMCC21224]